MRVDHEVELVTGRCALITGWSFVAYQEFKTSTLNFTDHKSSHGLFTASIYGLVIGVAQEPVSK